MLAKKNGNVFNVDDIWFFCCFMIIILYLIVGRREKKCWRWRRIQLCEMKFNFKLTDDDDVVKDESRLERRQSEHFRNYIFHSREIWDIFLIPIFSASIFQFLLCLSPVSIHPSLAHEKIFHFFIAHPPPIWKTHLSAAAVLCAPDQFDLDPKKQFLCLY